MIFVYSFKYYIIPRLKIRVRVMAFNTIFNNISDMSWQSVLLVEEIRVSGENHWPAASHWQTLSHNGVWVQLASCHDHGHHGPKIYFWIIKKTLLLKIIEKRGGGIKKCFEIDKLKVNIKFKKWEFQTWHIDWNSLMTGLVTYIPIKYILCFQRLIFFKFKRHILQLRLAIIA